MTTRTRFVFLALTALCAACAGSPVPAEPPATAPSSSTASAPPDGSAGIYREAQADRGRALFRDRCAECHYSSEMRGTQFQFAWERRTVGDLYEHLVATMPEDDPGSLAPEEYVDVVAYILRLNGFPAGGPALGVDSPAFRVSLQAPDDPRDR